MNRARKRKILCIEDDRETAALIAEELLERGYEVSLAADGREGFAADRSAFQRDGRQR